MIEIIDEKPVEVTTSNLALSIAEQETHISYMRDEPFALVYTSDTTQMTRLTQLFKDFIVDIFHLVKNYNF